MIENKFYVCITHQKSKKKKENNPFAEKQPNT